MKIFRTFEEILDYAIDIESDEVDFYSQMAQQMSNKNVSSLFHDIALEKMAHMLKLEKMKDLHEHFPLDKVSDMKIAKTLDDVDCNRKDLNYQEALIIAMKKEKANFSFYLELSKNAVNKECKTVFLGLSNEAARQKLRFEIEYDEYILQEN